MVEREVSDGVACECEAAVDEEALLGAGRAAAAHNFRKNGVAHEQLGFDSHSSVYAVVFEA